MTSTAGDGVVGPALDPLAVLLAAFEAFFALGVDPRTHAELGRRSGCGVPWIDLDLLRFLRASGPATVRELAGTSRRREPAVVRALQTLQNRGFVVRRHDPRDRRSLRIHLTPQGEKADDQRDRILRQVAQEVMADWAPGEVETLSALFSRYMETALARVAESPPAGGRVAR